MGQREDFAAMRELKGIQLFCLVVFLLVFLLAPAGRSTADEPTSIDLSATLKYVKDWAKRDSFPDSPALAYQNVYCRLALGQKPSAADRSKIIEFLKKCQKSDGGFATNPHLENSNVIFTYYSLSALDLLDASSDIDRDKATRFVLSLVQEAGGIKGSAGDATANLGTTDYGIRCLYLLKALDRLEKSRTVAYIESYRENSRGFGVIPGKPSAAQATFAAVNALNLLGGLTEDTKEGVVEFLKESPYSGLNEPRNRALLTVEGSACVLQTASLLSAVQQLNSERIYQFLESQFIPTNGGFGPSPGFGATPPSTYYAVVCLVKLGKLKDPYLPQRP